MSVLRQAVAGLIAGTYIAAAFTVVFLFKLAPMILLIFAVVLAMKAMGCV